MLESQTICLGQHTPRPRAVGNWILCGSTCDNIGPPIRRAIIGRGKRDGREQGQAAQAVFALSKLLNNRNKKSSRSVWELAKMRTWKKLIDRTQTFNRETIVGALWLIRVQAPMTRLLGPCYARSRKSVEIDITYRCNLTCHNCNRSCGQAPSVDQMTVDQLRKFTSESDENGIKWENIRILGGEPTLHPDILEILELLVDYTRRSSPDTRIHLATNGFGRRVENVLSQLPSAIAVENSQKTSSEQFFHPFNVAPQDRLEFRHADYSNGCEQTFRWGIGLTPYGYYPCALAGSIDRVFGFDIGRKTLPQPDDPMIDHLQVFCRLCGMFRYANHTRQQMMSPSWVEACAKYKKSKPVLSLY